MKNRIMHFYFSFVWLVPMHINPVLWHRNIKNNVEFEIMWHWPAQATNWFWVTNQELHLMLESRARLKLCNSQHVVFVMKFCNLVCFIKILIFFHVILIQTFFPLHKFAHMHFDYWFRDMNLWNIFITQQLFFIILIHKRAKLFV